MRELVVAGEGEFDGDAETLDGHDGDTADEGADGDVDNGVCATITGHDRVDHD